MVWLRCWLELLVENLRNIYHIFFYKGESLFLLPSYILVGHQPWVKKVSCVITMLYSLCLGSKSQCGAPQTYCPACLCRSPFNERPNIKIPTPPRTDNILQRIRMLGTILIYLLLLSSSLLTLCKMLQLPRMAIMKNTPWPAVSSNERWIIEIKKAA